MMRPDAEQAHGGGYECNSYCGLYLSLPIILLPLLLTLAESPNVVVSGADRRPLHLKLERASQPLVRIYCFAQDPRRKLSLLLQLRLKVLGMF